MNLAAYAPLYAGYAAALAALAIIIWRVPSVWPIRRDDEITRPWTELVVMVAAAVLTVVIGTALYNVDLAIKTRWLAMIVDTALEVVRFAPFLLALFVLRANKRSIWISPHVPWLHLIIGCGLAALGLCVLAACHGANPIALMSSVVPELNRRELHLPVLALHVFLEDLAIVLFAARLLAVCRSILWTALLVAALFAIGHIPALVTDGMTLAQVASLALDTMLGTGVLIALVRTRDILWFWPVHLVMDLTQFAS